MGIYWNVNIQYEFQLHVTVHNAWSNTYRTAVSRVVNPAICIAIIELIVAVDHRWRVTLSLGAYGSNLFGSIKTKLIKAQSITHRVLKHT